MQKPEQLGVNVEARSQRHRRVFLKSIFFSRFAFRFMLDLKYFLRSLYSKIAPRKSVYVLAPHEPLIVKDPFKKFLRQTVVVGIALLIVTSIAPSRILETGFTAEYFGDDSDFIEGEPELALPPFLMNEEGFVLKNAPISEDVSRIGLTDSVKHTVVQGDTLSGIASLYGISVKTLVWENNLSESDALKIGQTLVIPSVDGISYVAAKNDTLSRIAKEYSVDAKLIREHNNLSSDTIQKGQQLFIPGGKKKEPLIVRTSSRTGGRVLAANTFDTKVVVGSSDSPKEGKIFIFPSDGKVTQGFRAGHYANDIGNPAKPDVWTASSGTVVTAAGGCLPRDVKVDRGCGHGYGNYVVIDHGNGLQTLYAHLETIYVTEGQNVDSGQALGKMGSTGRSYGVTGIHLHFEVIDNGTKKNPANYY